MNQNDLYDRMGERFSIIKSPSSEGLYHITAEPTKAFDGEVIARNVRYSEAKAILRLIGEYDGES